MKVVVTGATGNVGTSVVQALSRDHTVDEIIGLARRVPKLELPKVTWRQADVRHSDLVETFRGAHAVVHLAWLIQPSHDLATLHATNVVGSRRVFDAVVEAEVPALIHASSVGAYSAGPKDRRVDESWPTDGISTLFYSRHKAEVERMLDGIERDNPAVRVVRLRPGLIFKRPAAAEIQRLFIGPLLPRALAQRRLIRVVPDLRRLRFQAVHSEDVGEAYRLAAVSEVRGAFNVAAEPILDPRELCRLLGARRVPARAGVIRAAAALTWRLRLQPSPPGWVDLALRTPLMDVTRAREELGWSPRRSSGEALLELLDGMHIGAGEDTPPLAPGRRFAPGRSRVRPRFSGTSSGMPDSSLDQQLENYLSDAYSIEKQALVQMKLAPKIADEPALARIFDEHARETEKHERIVGERLTAHGGSPSTAKNLVMQAGGVAFALFAKAQPDTPGKLTAHAYSYEALEQASYDLLAYVAERAGDEETAAAARRIRAEEIAMKERLAANFDAAVAASLRDLDPDDLGDQLVKYLADAHALEQQAIVLLEHGSSIVGDDGLARLFAEHLAQTREHARLVKEALTARGGRASALKDAAMRLGGLNWSGFFAAHPDTPGKLAAFAYAFEHLEIAGYELLKRVATEAADGRAIQLAERILAEERGAAEKLAAEFESAATASLAAQDVPTA